MADFTDVLVRVRSAKSGGNGTPSVHDVEASVSGSGLWKGESTFSLDSLDLTNPREYGRELGKQLLNPSLLRALDQAGLTRYTPIRLRLWLEDDVTVPHWVRWERIWINLNGEDWRLAVHPRVAFSRYIDVEQPDVEPPDADSFRLLLAVSNPTGLKPGQIIDVEAEIAKLLEVFEEGKRDRRLQVDLFPGRTAISASLRERAVALGWRVFEPQNTTLNRLADLVQQDYHGLHILAHGDFDPSEGVGSLLLENEQGGKSECQHTELQALVTMNLQLIVFHACLSGSPTAEGQSPFTSLAPRMVRLGVPAVIAMQDYVVMEHARTFFSEFYRSLVDEGLVDVAVNRGRQRLVENSATDNWSIPALFTRLRGGRLWRADALRQIVLAALANLPAREADLCPPQQVIEHSRGLAAFDPVEGASGPRFDLAARSLERLNPPGSFAVLTGPRGANKALHLRRVFRKMGEAFARSEPQSWMPVLLTLRELGQREPGKWGVLERAWKGEAREGELGRVQDREIIFLINGEEDAGGTASYDAVEAIERLRDALPKARFLLVADEQILPLFKRFDKVTLFAAQPLEWPKVSAFLETAFQDQDSKLAAVALNLRKRIEEGGLADLTRQPRFLQHMLNLAARGKPIESRRAVLADIVQVYLSRMENRRLPRLCAEEALERIAFEIQTSRGTELPANQLYEILNRVRDGREFTLTDFKSVLIDECRILVPSGDESVRFAYLALQWYFAARYIARSAERDRVIEDITASLGRLARVRRWERVLTLLADMLPSPGDLLRSVLSGSYLMEGEQVFLAARCFQEAMAGNTKSTKDLTDVVDQIVDTLISRSAWNGHRTYRDRRKSVEALVELAPLVCDRRPDVIAHLVGLACDEVPEAEGQPRHYDWSGIRQAAAFGLTRIAEPTRAYVDSLRPDLSEPLHAWFNLSDDPAEMSRLLLRDDPRVSVIAAVALAQGPRIEDREYLIQGYEECNNPEVLWGIVDAVSVLEAGWVQEKVIVPWIQGKAEGSAPDPLRRAKHACYLIQKTNFASKEAREFLAGCLLNGTPSLQGRALRAFGKLQDPEVEKWLQPLCEAIILGDAAAIDQSLMHVAPDQLTDSVFRRNALEALRDAGDEESLACLRRSRARYASDPDLIQLSFQVAEEMYWRLNGGMERESLSPHSN